MIFYVFLDGIGYGGNSRDTNPFARYSRSIFQPLGGIAPSEFRIHYLETDANMGVPGLPQSATGQTALWTGFLAPKILGRHLSGFPSFTLKKIISKHSMVKVLNQNGVTTDLLNCYTPAFYKRLGEYPKQISASTLVQMASDRPLKSLDDLRNGKGLYMDITHEFLKKINFDNIDEDDPILTFRDPYKLGYSIPTLFKSYGVCLYEYFLTDKIGHDQNWLMAEKAIGDLENFLTGFLDGMNPDIDTLIVTSDHGNLEDLTSSTHTMNPVPTLIAGKWKQELKEKINQLADIPPAIYQVLNLKDAYANWESSDFHNHRIQ